MNYHLSGSTVLITGGTGSFGETVTQFLLQQDVKEVRVLSRDEKKQHDLRLKLQDCRLSLIVGDVRDQDSVDNAADGVDFVFHAAALKQVPSCDFYPLQAVYTNILGPSNVIKACKKFGISKAVFLSTDKAVYPINAMGMSKALMEKVVISECLLEHKPKSSSPIFCCTRYGNVMGSRGSVIPLFIQQAKLNMPLLVTDPQMTRYLMSLDESVSLVIHAFQNGQDGDLFVQKSPACTILDLARAVIRITNSNSEVVVIGTRHGEKIHETLVSREEMIKAEDQGQYYRVPADKRGLNYGAYFEQGDLKISETEDYTSANTDQLSVDQVADLLVGLQFVRDLINA
jgi:UDP-N-acetylglucosamine 4,6-dehydratase/5-epimerase